MNGAGRLTVTPPCGRVARVLRPWAAWSGDVLDLARWFVVGDPCHAGAVEERSVRAMLAEAGLSFRDIVLAARS